MQKLEKTFGDIYVGYRPGTLNPLVVEVGRERFTDLGDFEDFVKEKVKEADVLKSALGHAKKINPQLLKIAQKYDKLYDKEFGK